MKKITLLVAIFAVFTMNAQIFFDDFEDFDISDWTLLDEDGDGFNFYAYDGGTGILTMSSQSWDSGTGPLTPNNYTISQAIDVTGVTGLYLDYQVGGQDPDYSQEVYTVYVSTGNTIADFENPAITVSFNEDLGDDPAAAGALVDRNLDISALDGATTVYIAFRHHDVTDQFVINFNNVSLDGILAISDNAFENFNYSIGSNNVLQLSSNSSEVIESISIYNIIGQKIISNNFYNTNISVDLSSYNTGVYIVKTSINGQLKTFKIIKK